MGAQGGGETSILQDGSYTFATGDKVTISDGHHIKIELAGSTAWDNFVNLSDLTKNGGSPRYNASAINNLAGIFVNFPANSEAVLSVSNVTKTPAEVCNSNGQVVFGVRRTNGNVSVIGGAGITINGIVATKTVTVETDTNASCLFMYFVRVKTVTVELDIGLTINGNKLI